MRLPSFNDFSPAILKYDLRPCLQAIVEGGGDDAKVVARWVELYFDGKANKRSSTNIPATLRSTGLTTGVRPLVLSEVGLTIAAAASAADAALIFCKHLIAKHNGFLVVEAITNLMRRGTDVTKHSLKAELKSLGVEALSNATTDHTTLKNWLIEAGLLDARGRPIDDQVKKVAGISPEESADFKALALGQQVFLAELRRLHLTSDGPFPTSDLLKACLDNYPELFDDANFAKTIQKPLVNAGWLQVSGLAKGPQGGRSGYVEGTEKLRSIPAESVVPDFEQVIPAEIKKNLHTPLSQIKEHLLSSDTYRGGLALELLALRMILDLGLHPRHFRLRSADTAHAEVDLIAEGAHLFFSRWTFQCKRNKEGTKVSLSDVAKECGIAIYAKAHVVVMVTTSSFSKEAFKFAQEVTRATPLQFVFVDGTVVRNYLESGKSALLGHFHNEAQNVLKSKREQPLPKSDA